MKKVLMAVVLVAGMMSGMNAYSQEADAEKAAVAASSEAKVEQTEEAKKAAKPKDTGFLSVITGSGWLGVVLWLALFGCGAAAIYFIVDSFILVKPQKIMPPTLINNVKAGMAEAEKDLQDIKKDVEAEEPAKPEEPKK